jgi:nitrogen fixation/metabolism regulation signal transduction histidine kinase
MQWPRLAKLAEAIRDGFETRPGEWSVELALEAESGEKQTLLLRGSRLPLARAGGYVVVFDDISQLIAAQRSAAWGEVARRLAHEIKNPLTPIQLSAERLQIKLAERLPAGEREILERSTATIVSQVEAMKNMVNDFRDYARLRQPAFAPFDLNALVREVLALYESSHARLSAALGAGDLPVAGDAAQLRQVIHNLLRNSEDALEKARQPLIEIETGQAEGMALLSVRDNGPGFAPDILARAFEPYVTSKARGTGLGLAIVRKIIDDHHGEIRLANRVAGGAEVRIRLPLARAGKNDAGSEGNGVMR